MVRLPVPIPLFYAGADGKLHSASAGNIRVCLGRGEPEQGANTVMIGSRFAFVDETRDLIAVTSEVGLRQIVNQWRGDHLAPPSPLAYRYEVGYLLSDQDEPLNDSGPTPGRRSSIGFAELRFRPEFAVYPFGVHRVPAGREN